MTACTHLGPGDDGRLPCTQPDDHPSNPGGHTYELGTHPAMPKEDD